MADIGNIVSRVSLVNTPAISSSATALASNPVRGAWSIQNLGTNPLYVRLGAGATTSLFHVVLQASVVQDDGTGGSLAQEAGVVYYGIVTIAGTNPRYTVTELTS